MKRFVRACTQCLCIVTLFAIANPATAQTYPDEPIHLIVGFPPGGGTDIVARLIAPQLSERLKQPVIVENRPGATGTIAAALVARAKPDGYTLLLGANSTNAIAPAVYHDLPYQESDLAGVALLASVPHIIAVFPGTGLKTLTDLVAYAKAHPAKLTFASPGYGSAPQLAGKLFDHAAGINIRHVPYNGAGQSLVDLLAGRVTVSFDTTTTLLRYVRSHQMNALAVTSAKRFPGLPDVPTAQEAGVKGYEFVTWMGLFAPRETPRPILERLNHEINAILASPDMQKKLADTVGSDGTTTASPEQFDALVNRDIKRFAIEVKQSNIKVN
jgi:tripartite-type tricarboxylate transporter receptor subunit TctC